MIRIALYFHSPAVSAQLLFIIDGHQSFVVGGVVRAVPVYSYVVEVGDSGIVSVAAADRTRRHAVVVGVGLLGDLVASATCNFALQRLVVSIRVFPHAGYTAVAVSVALSSVKVFNIIDVST